MSRAKLVYFRLLTAIGCVFLFSNLSYGQLTARQLVWSATKAYGPKYTDVEKAVALFGKRDFVEARMAMLEAVANHPELAPADTMLTMLFLSVGDAKRARNALDQAVIGAPDDPEAYIILGDLALRKSDLTVADLAYHKASQLLESFAPEVHRERDLKIRSLGGLSALSEARTQFQLATEYLEAWKKLDPKNPIPVGSLGRVSFYAKQYEQARVHFEELSKLEKSAPSAEIAMGGLYADMNMPDEAHREMKNAIEKSGDDIRTRITVAEWAMGAGLDEMAEENIGLALKTDPNSVSALLLKARLARHQDKLDDAEKTLTTAILKSPNNFSISNELARTLASSTDKTKLRTGLDYARRNFQFFGKQKTRTGNEAIFTFAWLLHQSDQFEAAAAALNALPDGSSISNENAYYAARIYSHLKNKAMAIGALKAALKKNQRFPGRTEAVELLKTLTATKPPESSK